MKRHRLPLLLLGPMAILLLLAAFYLWDRRSLQPVNLHETALLEFNPDVAKYSWDIPWELRRLDGRRISASGYMIPMEQATDFEAFCLVPELFNGGSPRFPPPETAMIFVHANQGKHFEYIADRIVVSGTIHVGLVKEGGYVISIMDLDADSVREADPTPPPQSSQANPLRKVPPHPFSPDPSIGSPFAGADFALTGWTALIALRLTVQSISSIRRSELRRKGLCSRCHYDLRATPDRCPECGNVPEPVKPRQS